MQSFPDGFRALVLGASGAIGGALARQLEADARCAGVTRLGRGSTPAVDFDDEASIAAAAVALKARGPFHLIVNAAGLLHTPQAMPEKRLGQLGYAQMEATFRANAFGPAMVLAHFAPLLDPERGVLAVLSAKVGSIGDNRLGGWYSYRASKAALNMFVKTAAIEVQRSQPRAVLVALHPGTVDSALSAPFRGREIGRTPAEAAADLLRVIDSLTPADTGSFRAYDGATLPW
jgi:NAD(P)-dependent dehydrogenase (short-subunit alcohol dehydrogenase family)